MERQELEKAGVDYAAGLEHFVENEALYVKYLGKFTTDGHFAAAWKAYDRLDYEAIEKEVHALKGLAGTLGMNRLFQACSVVVTELRKGNHFELNGQMEKVRMEYEKLVQAIGTGRNGGEE